MQRQIALAVACGIGSLLAAGWVVAQPGETAVSTAVGVSVARQTDPGERRDVRALAPSARFVHDRVSGSGRVSQFALTPTPGRGDYRETAGDEGPPDAAPGASAIAIQPPPASPPPGPGPRLAPLEMLVGIATVIAGLSVLASDDEADSC